MVVEGTALSGGIRLPAGAVIDLGPDSGVSNPTDSDVTVLVTTWTTPDAADG